ncbi:trypsin-like peptidase domain-containing protein [Portibacter marinus]|uniref:trypsin-like peptidase domain-containing protein n=1 Tax=Portibacter marinus TaxID=2898660 RepID=UPI001F41492E|nr:trypsin-like peptidase domain-containing protein [Portibacter marinus]
MEKIVDQFKDVVIQIATPYSTGTGFYISDYDVIVTNEHVVRDNREVAINGRMIDKQIAEVIYVDPKYDIAFIKAPQGLDELNVSLEQLAELREGHQVIAIGHPFGLKYTVTKGIISNMIHEHMGTTYLQHDAAINPGNSGGPLVNLDGQIIGINTFIIRDGNNIGFSLPVRYLIDTLDAFKEGQNQPGVRCNSCLNIVFDGEVDEGYCPHCGAKITMISDIDLYEPIGISKIIEEMLTELGFDVVLSRRGPKNWEITHGSAKINIAYNAKNGLNICDAYLCELPSEGIHKIYNYLLRQNHEIEGFSFSIKEQDIILSLLIFDQYLNQETGVKLFKELFDKADHYDNILVEEYGAVWKKQN